MDLSRMQLSRMILTTELQEIISRIIQILWNPGAEHMRFVTSIAGNKRNVQGRNQIGKNTVRITIGGIDYERKFKRNEHGNGNHMYPWDLTSYRVDRNLKYTEVH